MGKSREQKLVGGKPSSKRFVDCHWSPATPILHYRDSWLCSSDWWSDWISRNAERRTCHPKSEVIEYHPRSPRLHPASMSTWRSLTWSPATRDHHLDPRPTIVGCNYCTILVRPPYGPPCSVCPLVTINDCRWCCVYWVARFMGVLFQHKYRQSPD